MASAIPVGAKSADITRFAQRAAQLEHARPVVAYWCNYWIVDRLIAKGLHNTDSECNAYTVKLMDNLEQVKQDYAMNDAIVDDVAGQAYIEEFGLETFERAETAMRASKVTRQTADTYLAAATFLELCQIWAPLEPEIAAKIKYAKFHALRIAKAIKAGEDPNDGNPIEIQTDFKDPDTLEQEKAQGENDLERSAYQARVDDLTDEEVTHHDAMHPVDETQGLEVSPTFNLPSAPSTFKNIDATIPVEDFAQTPPKSAGTVNVHEKLPSPDTFNSSSSRPWPFDAVNDHNRQSPIAALDSTSKTQHPQASRNEASMSSIKDDEESISSAQKHAKWAISALSFDDVPTAIKELQLALHNLGAG